MNRKTLNTVFSLFPVICSQLTITRTPDNSNFSQFPSELQTIEITVKRKLRGDIVYPKFKPKVYYDFDMLFSFMAFFKL